MNKLQSKDHLLEDHLFFHYSFIHYIIVTFSKYGKPSHENARMKMLE